MAFFSDDGSMNSNRAQYSATFSHTNARPGSGDLPDDFASDAPSDQAAEIALSASQQGLRQPRKTQIPRSRPVSRTAVDNQTGKESPAGSESRLRHSVNSADDLGSNEAVASQPLHQHRRSSPSNDAPSPGNTSARPVEATPLSRAVGEPAEGPSYGQETPHSQDFHHRVFT